MLYIICDGEGTGTGLASTTDVRVPTPEFRGVRFQLPSAVFPCFIVPPAPPGVIVVFLNRLPMCVPATPVYLNRNDVPETPVTFYRYDESRSFQEIWLQFFSVSRFTANVYFDTQPFHC